MHFDLSDDQKAIGDQVTALLRDHLPEERLVAQFDDGALDRDLFGRLNGLAIGAIMVPADRGGLGLDLLTLAVVAEALGQAGAAVPTVGNALAAWLVATAGTDEQRERWLGPLAEGRAIAAFAFAEPEQGWQPEDWTLSSPVADGDKLWVEWGAEADLLIVGTAGGRLMIADPAGPGVARTPVSAVDRTRPLAEIRFDGAPLEPLGDAEASAAVRDAMLVLLAADAFGAARRALAMATDYAKVRTQFGQIIGSFQGLKHQLANMAAEIEPCRALCWYAAHAWDSMPAQRSYAAAMAKAHVTDVAVANTRLAVEAHGGIGYTWEYPLHVFLKRAMFDRVAMGLPMVQRARAADLAGW